MVLCVMLKDRLQRIRRDVVARVDIGALVCGGIVGNWKARLALGRHGGDLQVLKLVRVNF